MLVDIEQRRSAIAGLCLKYRVRRLELFGSTTRNTFDENASDLDFLVEFHPMRPVEHADCYFGLQEDLQQLFEKPVDLVEHGAVRNPYFLADIELSRRLVYAA